MHLPEPIPPSVHDETLRGRHLPHPRRTRARAADRDGQLERDVRAPRAAVEGDAAEHRAEEAAGRSQTQDRGPGVLRHAHLGHGADRLLARLARPVRAAAPEPGRGPGRARAPVRRGDGQPRLQLRTDQGRAEHAARRLGLLHGQVPRDRRRRAGVAARTRQRLPRPARCRRAARRGGRGRGCTRTPRSSSRPSRWA